MAFAQDRKPSAISCQVRVTVIIEARWFPETLVFLTLISLLGRLAESTTWECCSKWVFGTLSQLLLPVATAAWRIPP